MKKLLAVLMCFALMLTSFVVALAAEPKVDCTLSAASVKMGDTVTLTVSVSGFAPIRSGAIALNYDTTVFSYVESEWLIDASIKSFDPDKHNGIFAYFPAVGHDINGNIFRVVLKALTDATVAGDLKITATPQLLDDNGANAAEGYVAETTVEVLCAEHKYGALVAEQPAKCGTAGKAAYYQCSVCHKLFDEDKNETTEQRLVLPALQHTAAEDWQTDQTDHWKICSRPGCGTLIEGTKAAHDFAWTVDTPATEDAPGVQHEECSVCHIKRSEGTVIPKLDHVHTGITHHAAKAANCHEGGNIEYWTCSSPKCADKFYADAACSATIDKVETPIDPAAHDGETEVRNAAEATEDADGYTGDTYCLGCGKLKEQGTAIPKLDHVHTGITHHAAKVANCHEGGNVEYWTCSSPKCADKFYADAACSATIDKVETPIDPAAHDGETEVRNAAEATEDADGYTGDTYCLGCGKLKEQGSVIPKLAHTHTMTKTEEKPATCEEDGNIAYFTCEKCGNKYADEEGTRLLTDDEIVLTKTGHRYGEEWKTDAESHWHECTCGKRADTGTHDLGEWTITKAAGAAESGSRERKCSTCGYTQTETIAATGDDGNATEDGNKAPQTGVVKDVFLWGAALALGSSLIVALAAKKGKKCAH